MGIFLFFQTVQSIWFLEVNGCTRCMSFGEKTQSRTEGDRDKIRLSGKIGHGLNVSRKRRWRKSCAREKGERISNQISDGNKKMIARYQGLRKISAPERGRVERHEE